MLHCCKPPRQSRLASEQQLTLDCSALRQAIILCAQLLLTTSNAHFEIEH
jgi:hypothetical protein